MNTANIHILLKPDEKKIVEKASEIVCLGYSTFSRMVVVKEARKILDQYKQGVNSQS